MTRWTCYAVLAAVAMQPLMAAAQETPPAPAERPQVALDADNIFVNEDENTVIAEGNVEAAYEGRILRADRLVYNRTTDKVRATGNVVILDPDGTQRFAAEIETDSNLSDGYAIGFSTRMPNGGTATAASAVREGDGFNALDRVVYTSCEVCEDGANPTWALRARRAVLDQESKMISYQDAVLEVAGVPVLYLPYFAHPDPNSERRSGLLAPDFGTSSKLGLFYQQPYYWAISPSQDMTISPQVMANVAPLLEIEYRKRFWSGTFQTNFSFTKESDFDSDGKKFGENEWRGHIFADGRFDITENWQWGFGVEQVSDDLYTRRYDIDGERDLRGLYNSQPRRLLNQLFVKGQSTAWYADASLLSFEGLRATDDDDTLPIAAPLLYAEHMFDFGNLGLLSVNGSAAFLTRETGIDSERASVGADWAATRVLPGGFVLQPFAEARFDTYALDETISGVDSVERGGANLGTRLSYPLYRPGETVDILIEPTAMVAYGSANTNDAAIPVEDSLFYEFDESTLFEANAYSGYDLFEGGPKASLGVSATATWKNGVSIRALGGRRWRDQSDNSFNTSSNLDGTVSDWVAGLSADFGNPLRIETRVRLDDEDLGLNRIDAKVSSRWDRLRGSVRYYRIDESITLSGIGDEGLDIRGDVRVTDHYYFVYGRQRDVTGGRDIRHSFGVAYEDDCSRFEVAFERSEAIDRTLGPNDSLKFRFSLKTLGNFGSSDVD